MKANTLRLWPKGLETRPSSLCPNFGYRPFCFRCGRLSPYASRVLRLVLLAPDVQEAILFGEQPAELTLSQLMEGVGLVW